MEPIYSANKIMKIEEIVSNRKNFDKTYSPSFILNPDKDIYCKITGTVIDMNNRNYTIDINHQLRKSGNTIGKALSIGPTINRDHFYIHYNFLLNNGKNCATNMLIDYIILDQYCGIRIMHRDDNYSFYTKTKISLTCNFNQ